MSKTPDFAKYKIRGRLAVACSGGIDSMALAFLASRELDVVALVVDHSLRKESKTEAKCAAKILDKLGIENHILTHKGKKPESNIQENAREIRYELLTRYCREHKIKHLATAHNAEDNAETFLLRLSRGSGVDGLAAIPEITVMNKIKIIRPVLGFSRAELKAILTGNNIEWVEDPTNATDKYKRNKLRSALAKLEDPELITARINEAAANLSRVKDFLEEETAKAEKLTVKYSGKSAEIKVNEFLSLHDEIAFRLLLRLISRLSPHGERPRFHKLKRLKPGITAGQKRTLSGLVFTPDRRKNPQKITISIEK